MSLADNKALVRRFTDEVMTAGNTAAIAELCIAGSAFAGGISGQVRAMKTAFPDLRMTIDEIVAEGDRVAIRVTTHATNTGPLVGLPAFGRLEKPVPPTGQSVTGSGMYMFTISDGKILSFAYELDQIGLLQQLGWAFTAPSHT